MPVGIAPNRPLCHTGPIPQFAHHYPIPPARNASYDYPDRNPAARRNRTPADRVTIPKTRPSGRDVRFWAKMEAGDARHKAQIKRMEKKLDAFGDRLLLQCSIILFAALALAVVIVKYCP